ncbi:MAG TPA: ABC transporter permease [Pyrinomonadaceae bacterium]|nr:ABC transporter permease [Pyrinomonadaceae bacterium]
MRAFLQDLRFGARVLRKRPGFTAVAVLALALGIGANTAIFSVVEAVLLRPLPYERPEQLVLMYEDGRDVQNRWVSYPNFLDWRARNRSFEAMSTIRGWDLTLTGDGGPPESLTARMVSADYFDVMRVRPLVGRAFLREEDRPGAAPVTVLSHGFWQRRFGGDPDIVGKTITLDDKPFTVVGVMPPEFRHQGPPPLWVLMGQWTGQDNWMQRDVRVAGNVVARLKDGVTIEQARADMANLKDALTRESPYTNAGHVIRVVPLKESIVGESRTPLLLMFGAVGFVLLIACANVANLLLARATTRRREFAIRAALGASGRRLARQLLAESLLLAALGGAAGLLLAWWGVDLLCAAEPPGLPGVAGAGVNARVALFTFGLTLLTGVVFGLAPAWRANREDVSDALKGTSTAAGGGAASGGRLRGALVVTEVALAFVLLVGAGLLTRSLVRLLNSNPGFDPTNVLTMPVTLSRQRYQGKEEITRFQRELLARVSALPGVEAACISNSLPGFPAWQNDIAVEGGAPIKAGEELNVDWSIVSEDYFRVMRVPVLRGRTFTEREAREGSPVVVVDENLARRFWPGQDAVGKRIKYDSPTPHEIVGVVGNVKNFGSEAEGRIRIYTPLGRAGLSRGATLGVRASSGGAEALASAVAREIQAIDKDMPAPDAETLEQIFRRETAPRRFNAALLALLAAVALVLAAVGIYGVMAYTVAQRTHEFGVRLALGAGRGDVLRLVLGGGMKLVLLGVGAGLAAALALTRLMSSLLFGVAPTDPLTFCGIALLLTLVALLASYIPARRATKVDPMIALRYE